MAMVRVGVVSATGTGRKRTLPAMLASETCKVTAIHARDEAKVRKLGEDFGIKRLYTDLGSMIADAVFDIAVVDSPPSVHLQQVETLLKAGIPTLCEKPLALSEEIAVAIQKLQEETSTPVMVAHQLRHQSTYQEIKKTIDEGEIGEVLNVSCAWHFLLDPEGQNAKWKTDPALNGPTCMGDAGVHCVDLAIGLFGPGKVWGATAKRQTRQGVIEACDVLAVHSGVRVTYDVSRLQAPRSNHLVISGDKGEIVAPHFFTEQSAPWIKIESEDTERVIKRIPGNPYRKVIEDFAAMTIDPDFVSPGTTVAEAVAACKLIDEAQDALGVSLPLAEEAEMVEDYER